MGSGQTRAPADGFSDFLSFPETSIRRNPNRRAQEHEKKKKKKRGEQRWRQRNGNVQSSICISPVISPLSAIYTRAHTRGHRHGPLSAGPLHASPGQRQGPAAGGRAGHWGRNPLLIKLRTANAFSEKLLDK